MTGPGNSNEVMRTGLIRRDHLRAATQRVKQSVRARFASSARKPNCYGHSWPPQA
jgi:hypothetical protein